MAPSRRLVIAIIAHQAIGGILLFIALYFYSLINDTLDAVHAALLSIVYVIPSIFCLLTYRKIYFPVRLMTFPFVLILSYIYILFFSPCDGIEFFLFFVCTVVVSPLVVFCCYEMINFVAFLVASVRLRTCGFLWR